ncbi:MAG: VCBS repeat-containing protein [Acidobacteria bacterium]|nr:VCBS repeat-containing protein [Acidobacteriota bacterium]
MKKLIIVAAGLLGLTAALPAEIPTPERRALIMLYSATNGNHWTHRDNWLGPAGTECTWYGVTCDPDGEHVIGIEMRGDPAQYGTYTGNNLQGPIPDEIGDLPYLEKLDLSYNSLTGELPAALNNLQALHVLDLRYNQLTGTLDGKLIPLTELNILRLNDNLFSGPIPADWGSLTGLGQLEVQFNDLSGTIPPALGGLPSLEELRLTGNRLGGTIPPELGDLPALKYLFLEMNDLSGPIPPELGNLTNLEQLSLFDNRLSGPIPFTLGNLTRLQFLNLISNQLSGVIPPQLGALPDLMGLYLNDNQLSGPIPSELGNAQSLRWLWLNSNQLSGALPDQLGNLENLEFLFLYDNFLSGTIPSTLGNLAQLQMLWLSNNDITGLLPPQLGNLAGLLYLYLYDNRLEGPVPPEFGNLAAMLFLSMSNNRLQGEIPPEFANLQQLVSLDPTFNALEANDPTVRQFLDDLLGYELSLFQTIVPENFTINRLTAATAHFTWNLIPYSWDDGGYQILVADDPAGPFRVLHTTSGKDFTGYRTCLCTDQDYYFSIRSFTEPNEYNQNRVYSQRGPVLAASTAGANSEVTIHAGPAPEGSIFPNSPSQLLPAPALTFEIPSGAFPEATPAAPVLIWLALPEGVRLSQTLATGDPATTAPQPSAGETVVDLAVCEYVIGEQGEVTPVAGGVQLDFIEPRAVQLFRYVTGEKEIWIRINESTTGWQPVSGGDFLGFTIGLGEGVWPVTEACNWGTSGRHQQASTLFFMDLRAYDFDAAAGALPVRICSFYQQTLHGRNTAFSPAPLTLFTLENEGEWSAANSTLRTAMTDFALADLNGDGYADLLAVERSRNLLSWALGQSDGTFVRTGQAGLAGAEPATIVAGDISGDSRPDVLVGDDSGLLNVYLWEDLFGPGAGKAAAPLSPSRRHKLAGVPSDSLLRDVNNDGIADFLYTSEANQALLIAYGAHFQTTDSYPAGTTPTALAAADFDGNDAPDVVVVSRLDDAAYVFRNDGLGQMTMDTLPAVGARPVDVTAADFDGNGRPDLVLALAGDQAVRVFYTDESGAFSGAAPLYFMHTPAALLADNFDGLYQADILTGFEDYHRLALCVSDEAGDLSVDFYLDTLPDLVVNPGQGGILAEDAVLSVAGGTGFGGISQRQGVAAVGGQGYQVVHFPRSRDLSFSLVNLGPDEALVNFELYESLRRETGGGALRFTGRHLASTTRSIPAGAQFARYLAGLFEAGADSWDVWARAFLTAKDIHGFWLVNNGADLTYLDGAQMPSAWDTMSEFVFPMIMDGPDAFTQLILLNPSTEPVHVQLTTLDAEGTAGESHALLIEGRGRAVVEVDDLFAAVAPTDSIRVRSDQPVCGVQLFGTSLAVASLMGLKTGQLATVQYSPHMAVGDFGVVYSSVVTLVNTASTAASVEVTLLDDLGTALRPPEEVDVPAGGKRSLDLAAMFNLSEPTTGFIRVDSRGDAGVVGCVTFGDASQGRLLSCLPLQAVEFNRFLLGHIANGTLGDMTYFTGLAIVNPAVDPTVEAEIRITAYDQTGVALDTRKVMLGGTDPQTGRRPQRAVFLLNHLMPDLTSLFGGYLLVENSNFSQGILVFELFGDMEAKFLSAVPAIPVNEE